MLGPGRLRPPGPRRGPAARGPPDPNLEEISR